MKRYLPILLALGITAQAQPDFRAYLGKEESLEGGWMQKLTVVTSDLQFNIAPPRGWSCVTDTAGRKIVFTSASGRSAITVRFTGNSPGELPDTDVLREQVRAAHPGAGVLISSACPTSYRPAVFFDLVLMPSPGNILKVRHAYVADPAGEVEFVFSANEDEFDQYRPILMGMLRNFRVSKARLAAL